MAVWLGAAWACILAYFLLEMAAICWRHVMTSVSSAGPLCPICMYLRGLISSSHWTLTMELQLTLTWLLTRCTFTPVSYVYVRWQFDPAIRLMWIQMFSFLSTGIWFEYNIICLKTVVVIFGVQICWRHIGITVRIVVVFIPWCWHGCRNWSSLLRLMKMPMAAAVQGSLLVSAVTPPPSTTLCVLRHCVTG